MSRPSAGEQTSVSIAGNDSNMAGQEKEQINRRILTRLQARTAASASRTAIGGKGAEATIDNGNEETSRINPTTFASNRRHISPATPASKLRASLGSSKSVSNSDLTSMPPTKRTSARLASSSSNASTTSNRSKTQVASDLTASNTPRQRTNKRSSLVSSNQILSSTPTARPKFSTYQQQYTPSKTAAASLSTPTKSQHQGKPGTQQRQPTLSQLRKQTELLQLSLIHSSCLPTLKAWEGSAKEQFSARFATLAATHHSLLALQRLARQHRNLLALHQWSGCNTAALVRKSNTLLSVLSELCVLASPSPLLEPGGLEANAAGGLDAAAEKQKQDEGRERGAYSAVVQQFETWVTWVLDVWHERDLQQQEHQRSLSQLRTAIAAAEQRGSFQEEEEMVREYQQQQRQKQQHFTRIDGLGDVFKAELRRLGGVLNGFEARLLDLNNPAIPAHPLPSRSSNYDDKIDTRKGYTHEGGAGNRAGELDAAATPIEAETDTVKESLVYNSEEAHTGKLAAAPLINEADTKREEGEELEDKDDAEEGKGEASTPRRILDITMGMLQNMKQELQLMRELDFEVVIGEQAWVEWAVHGIGNEIERLLYI